MAASRLMRLAMTGISAVLVAGVATAINSPASAASIQIKSFSVSPAKVGSGGGKITFRTKTVGARSCEISSSVRLNSMPATVACASGTSTKSITIPGANSTSNKSFVFTFTARNGTLATTARVTVVRVAVWPKVDTITTRIRTGRGSDSLRVQAKVRFARTCTLSVHPSVAGLPSSGPCTSGTYFKATAIPKNTSGSNRTFTVRVAATSPSGVTKFKTSSITQPGTGVTVPGISAFGSTPSALSAAGGNYTFTATVQHATTCTLAITPSIASAPSPAACTSGSYNRTISISANTSGAARTYKFVFTAANSGGSASATINLTQPTAAPSITDLGSAPQTMPAGGGSLTVSAAIAHGTTCTFTSSPDLGLSPSPVACAGSAFSKSVSLPQNTAPTERSYTFALTLDGPGGTTTSTLSVPQAGTAPPAPAIPSFSTAPTTTAAGGTYTASATVTNASSCTFSTTPDRGAGTTADCSRGTFSAPFTLPANTTASVQNYQLQLVATGAGGGTATSTLTVTQPAAPPAITSFTSNPATLTAAAATLALTASITRATTCALTSTPAVSGSTNPVSCTGGSFSGSASIPANTGTSTKSYLFTLKATGPGGTAAATLTISQPGTGPAITAYKATPAAVTAAGGTVTFSASITNAATCTFASSPAVSGSTAPFDCSGGTFSRAVTIPSNSSGATINYSFTLTATGPAGSASTSATLSQPTAAPAITSFALSPPTLTAAGGAFTVSASIARAATCVLTSSPDLGTSATADDCSGGTFSRNVTIPQNTTTSTMSYLFTLKATGPGGAVTATLTVSQPAAAPAITSFGSSPATVSAAGGSVTFSATIARASTCTFTSNPAISGSTAPFDCSAGTFSRAVTIPANTGATTKSYVFTLSATGPGGTASGSVTLTQPAAPPSISAFSAAPSTVTASGGNVTLTATVARGSTCVLSSVPDLGISAAPVSCSAGSVSRAVSIPANSGGSTKSYVFTLKATGNGGTATGTLTLTQPANAPSISNYQASPGTVAAGGGTVTFSASVALATTCTFTPTASLGSPTTVNCSSGSFSQAVSIPANTSGSTRSYTFQLTATGAGGTYTASITMQQLTAPASVSNPSMSPATLTASGGNVTIGATIANATNCTLSSTPTLGLSSAPFACNGAFSRIIAIPANQSAAEKSYSISLAVNGAGGNATAGYPVKVPAAPPTLTQYSANPSTVTAAGASVTFTATISLASSCTFTPPASLGAPATTSCTGTSFSKAVSVPPNSSGATRSFTFTLEVDGAGGSKSASITLTQPSS